MATGKPAHLGCKFLSDVSVANSPMMMGEIVARNTQSKAIAENKNAIVASCWTYFTTIE